MPRPSHMTIMFVAHGTCDGRLIEIKYGNYYIIFSVRIGEILFEHDEILRPLLGSYEEAIASIRMLEERDISQIVAVEMQDRLNGDDSHTKYTWKLLEHYVTPATDFFGSGYGSYPDQLSAEYTTPIFLDNVQGVEEGNGILMWKIFLNHLTIREQINSMYEIGTVADTLSPQMVYITPMLEDERLLNQPTEMSFSQIVQLLSKVRILVGKEKDEISHHTTWIACFECRLEEFKSFMLECGYTGIYIFSFSDHSNIIANFCRSLTCDNDFTHNISVPDPIKVDDESLLQQESFDSTVMQDPKYSDFLGATVIPPTD